MRTTMTTRPRASGTTTRTAAGAAPDRREGSAVDLILGPLGFDFFVRSLAASALVGLLCAVVGSYVVLKGLAFVGDALSHAAFPGVVAAFMLRGPYYVGAGLAAVGAAIAITWVTRRSGLRADTSIGVVFAGTFALGIFLYS